MTHGVRMRLYPEIHHTSHSIKIACVCSMVSNRQEELAQSCPPEPPNHLPLQDRTLVVMVLDRSDDTWRTYEVIPGDPPHVTFNQNSLCLFYGVKSDRLRIGALVIPVTRTFSIPVGENSSRVFLTRGNGFFIPVTRTFSIPVGENSSRVFLTRGNGFFWPNGTVKERWDGDRTLNFYNQFHNENLSDPGFREDFHGYWHSGDESSNTAAPRSRLRAFRYMDNQSASVLRRTYLLHYRTSSEGSWIPFYIETAGEPQNLDEIRLSVWDFGSSTDEPVFTGSVVR